MEAGSWSCSLRGLSLCGTGPASQLCGCGLLTQVGLRSGLERALIDASTFLGQGEPVGGTPFPSLGLLAAPPSLDSLGLGAERTHLPTLGFSKKPHLQGWAQRPSGPAAQGSPREP